MTPHLPHLPEHPTDLTPEQRAYLVGLRGFLTAPPTGPELYLKNLPKLAIYTVLLGGVAVWSWSVGELWAVWFAVGMLSGLLIITAANINRAVRLWPATAAVVDRDQLDELLGEHAPGRDRP